MDVGRKKAEKAERRPSLVSTGECSGCLKYRGMFRIPKVQGNVQDA